MERVKPIRITKNDRKEFAKLAKNTKAKIARTTKKYGVDLSNEIELPDLKSFKTREEFNKWKEKASSFTNRNNQRYQFKKNEYGVVASKKRINEIERNNRQAQRNADKLRSEAVNKPFVSGGKVQGTVGQRLLQMGRPTTAGISRPPDFKFNKIRSQRDLERIEKNMQQKSDKTYVPKKMEQMKLNFMKLMELSFNSDADNLVDKLANVPADIFYEMYLMFDEFDFDLYSYETENNDAGDFKQLERYIDDYFNGKISFDLKGF